MNRLQITKVYRYGFVNPRVFKQEHKDGIHCSSCYKCFQQGMGCTNPTNNDEMCVGAIANGWKLYDTSTFCDMCSEGAFFPVYRAAGWLFNFFPPPVPILLALLLAAGASLVAHKIYTSYGPVQEEVTAMREQTS